MHTFVVSSSFKISRRGAVFVAAEVDGVSVSALQDLLELVPPPPAHGHVEVDWNLVEVEMGLRLTSDYKSLVDIYGAGQFDRFLTVYQPVTPFLNTELAYRARRQNEILAQLRDGGREHIPFTEGTLLPVAGTDNGDTIYWVLEPQLIQTRGPSQPTKHATGSGRASPAVSLTSSTQFCLAGPGFRSSRRTSRAGIPASSREANLTRNGSPGSERRAYTAISSFKNRRPDLPLSERTPAWRGVTRCSRGRSGAAIRI